MASEFYQLGIQMKIYPTQKVTFINDLFDRKPLAEGKGKSNIHMGDR